LGSEWKLEIETMSPVYTPEKMVGRVGFEPTTIGLKDSYLIYQVFINQSLTVFVHLHCARKR